MNCFLLKLPTSPKLRRTTLEDGTTPQEKAHSRWRSEWSYQWGQNQQLSKPCAEKHGHQDRGWRGRTECQSARERCQIYDGTRYSQPVEGMLFVRRSSACYLHVVGAEIKQTEGLHRNGWPARCLSSAALLSVYYWTYEHAISSDTARTNIAFQGGEIFAE